MLGSSWVAAQLVASQEGLSSVSKQASKQASLKNENMCICTLFPLLRTHCCHHLVFHTETPLICKILNWSPKQKECQSKKQKKKKYALDAYPQVSVCMPSFRLLCSLVFSVSALTHTHTFKFPFIYMIYNMCEGYQGHRLHAYGIKIVAHTLLFTFKIWNKKRNPCMAMYVQRIWNSIHRVKYSMSVITKSVKVKLSL
jgi:hypothetical protein